MKQILTYHACLLFYLIFTKQRMGMNWKSYRMINCGSECQWNLYLYEIFLQTIILNLFDSLKREYVIIHLKKISKNSCIIIHEKVSTFLYISSLNISLYIFKAITFQFCKRNKKDIHHLISCIIIKKIYIWTCVSLVIQISFIWIAKLISYQDVSFVSENVINEISAYAPVFNYVSLPPLFSALSLTTVLSNTKCINMSITSLSSLYPFSGLFFIHFLPSTILDTINDIAVNQLTKIDI